MVAPLRDLIFQAAAVIYAKGDVTMEEAIVEALKLWAATGKTLKNE